MRMATQYDFDISEVEPELLDTASNRRHGRLKVSIDKNVPVWRRDEEAAQLLRSDKIDIVDNLMCGERCVPVPLRERRG